jgi:E3 ubiquitin-protein ligase HUWE1
MSAGDGHPPANVPALGWDTLVVEHPHMGNHGHIHRHYHGNRSPFPPGFLVSGHRDPLGGMSNRHLERLVLPLLGAASEPEATHIPMIRLGSIPSNSTNRTTDFRSYFSRGHRSSHTPINADDGVNPLLRRTANSGRDSSPRSGGPQSSMGLRLSHDLFSRHFLDAPVAILNEIMASVPGMRHAHPALHVQLHQNARGEIRELHVPSRESRSERRDGTHQEPQQAVTFTSGSTVDRYQEEARVVFGTHLPEKANRLIVRILAALVPPAIEAEKKRKAEEDERRKKADEERKQRLEEEERKKAEEQATREKKEAEQREQAEAAAAVVAAEAAANAAQVVPVQEGDGDDDVPGADEVQAMQGVETNTPQPVSGEQDATPGDQARVVTTIRGEQVDVTELGIDPDYLEALPEEFREEVIAQTVSTRRNQAREEAPSGEPTALLQEFLEALPEDIRLEILQQERQEMRRRERDEQRRQAAPSGQGAPAGEMDTASILLTFPEELRQQVLMEQGEEIIDQLPPEMAAQARALAQHHQHHHHHGHSLATGRIPAGLSRRNPQATGETARQSESKSQRRPVVQMLDKAGVATLLRLMFMAQHKPLRNSLFSVFADICENRQNRLEVVSSLLQILQDGSIDMDAVERSFSQLSLKAKKPKDKEADQKTPQNLKRTLTTLSVSGSGQTNSEISPLLIVQQCLDLLAELSGKNLHIPTLFLVEHETVGTSLKRTFSRKGKAKESKAHKYAINSLLTLLDRDLVMESSDVMNILADLLNRVTLPLQNLERRRREAEAAEKGNITAEAPKKETSSEAPPADVAGPVSEATDSHTTSENPETTKDEEPKMEDKAEAALKKTRQLQPPVIPSQNLNLVVRIFVAPECSSKTFQNTIATIKNLSCIPGAKAVFGQELVRQATVLSKNIVSDLDDLLPHIEKATSGTEIQGVALAKFSPGASEQNKLLRVLTALDHLFESKKKGDGKDQDGETSNENEKQDLVTSLYNNSTFATMWEKLSACLSAIRQRESLLSVATILLPLIESLMVVCKNTAIQDAPMSQSQMTKDMLLSSPPPESRMAGLFFTFTEEHRRILNELVRNNPKLMSGTFSLLVKNPKVLEFDNKRNYFNRSVHARNSSQNRPSYPPLQLSVRRDQVFHDSFRSLYYKSGDEMKFGKLNIRFHGEEGVDAGGVTREWFQVLSRQMFDPNYALFRPVSSDRTTFHPAGLSGVNDEHLLFFKFIGRIIGKALYEGRVLDCYFSRAVYKRILGKSVSVKDMESIDPDYYKSLVWMLDNDITDIITETMSVEDNEFGATKIVDLCPNGREIPVTEENKHEYVRLVTEFMLLSSVKDQMEHFLKGK